MKTDIIAAQVRCESEWFNLYVSVIFEGFQATPNNLDPSHICSRTYKNIFLFKEEVTLGSDYSHYT